MTFNKLYIIAALVLISGLFSNCSIEKRHYRKGFHVSWHKKSNTESKENKAIAQEQAKTVTEPAVIPVKKVNDSPERTLMASVEQYAPAAIRTIIKKFKPLVKDSCGDVLLMRNGDELTVKITERNGNIIHYKRCDNPDGPLYSTNTDKVFMIKYENGSKEIFKKEIKDSPVQIADTKPKEMKNNGFAVASFICAMFAFLVVPGVLALIFGCIAQDQFNKHPGNYKGKWMATVGIIVGGITTFILLLVILANL